MRGGPVGDAACDHSAIAVGTKDHFREILKSQKVQDVGDMGVQVNGGCGSLMLRMQAAEGYSGGLMA